MEERALSTSLVAQLMGASSQSVMSCIEQGHLKADLAQDGRRRVKAGELIRFMLQKGLPIPPQLARRHPKLLVADNDSTTILWVGSVILEKYPRCEVLQVRDGSTAMQLAAAAKPDVVILDLLLPRIDGYQVCRHIKGNSVTKDVSVIAITGQPLSSVRAGIMDCGAQVCLSKPLDAERLWREFELAIARRHGEKVVAGHRQLSVR